MHLGERNWEGRTGRTKVRLGTDVEASMYEAQVGVCPHSKARGDRIRRQGCRERLYKQLVTRGQAIDVVTDSQYKNQGAHAPSILAYGVIDTQLTCAVYLARSYSKCSMSFSPHNSRVN